jgi:2-keto-4-pentenoate hydratase/2-oxohepta-3-ene-1,7-dioic acid hydratase in catechol pathway
VFALVADDRVYEIADPFARGTTIADLAPSEANYVAPLRDVECLAPCVPGLVVGVHGNCVRWYENVADRPQTPRFFLKSPRSVIGPNDDVAWPPESVSIAAEGEVAVVMAKTCHRVDERSALDYVLGITCANDVTAWDLSERDLFAGKSFPTFLPLGPAIAPLSGDVRFECRIDDRVVQESTTKDFVFDLGRLVAEVSAVTVLEPQDVILCGAAPEVEPPLPRRCTMSISIDGVGTLANRLI